MQIPNKSLYAKSEIFGILGKFIVSLIRIYRFVFSPVLPRCCRFVPSCSQYAEEAVIRHGPFVGIVLTVRRLLRCNPWTQGGYDPVP